MMKIIVMGFAFLIGTAQSVDRCRQCGMDLSKYQRTQYEIVWTDGSVIKTCGVQCGLTQQILHQGRFKSATAKIITPAIGLTPGKAILFLAAGLLRIWARFIAFRLRADAEKFQAESGGQVLNFEEALSAWTQRRAGH
jgi:hypothetical protein